MSAKNYRYDQSAGVCEPVNQTRVDDVALQPHGNAAAAANVGSGWQSATTLLDEAARSSGPATEIRPPGFEPMPGRDTSTMPGFEPMPGRDTSHLPGWGAPLPKTSPTPSGERSTGNSEDWLREAMEQARHNGGAQGETAPMAQPVAPPLELKQMKALPDMKAHAELMNRDGERATATPSTQSGAKPNWMNEAFERIDKDTREQSSAYNRSRAKGAVGSRNGVQAPKHGLQNQIADDLTDVNRNAHDALRMVQAPKHGLRMVGSRAKGAVGSRNGVGAGQRKPSPGVEFNGPEAVCKASSTGVDCGVSPGSVDVPVYKGEHGELLYKWDPFGLGFTAEYDPENGSAGVSGPGGDFKFKSKHLLGPKHGLQNQIFDDLNDVNRTAHDALRMGGEWVSDALGRKNKKVSGFERLIKQAIEAAAAREADKK